MNKGGSVCRMASVIEIDKLFTHFTQFFIKLDYLTSFDTREKFHNKNTKTCVIASPPLADSSNDKLKDFSFLVSNTQSHDKQTLNNPAFHEIT
jgi:hypothetical protein